MRVLITHSSGIDDRGQYLAAGQSFDVAEALALDLIKRGHAVRPLERMVEIADAGPVETVAFTTKPRPRGRPRKVFLPGEDD